LWLCRVISLYPDDSDKYSYSSLAHYVHVLWEQVMGNISYEMFIPAENEHSRNSNQDGRRLKLDIIIIIIIIIQFNSLLFMCRVNSYKANYRHSTAYMQ
jgi:hypothetical protein